MPEFNGLTRADRDMIAVASRIASIEGMRRSGQHAVLVGKSTSFIGTEAGWIAGKTVKPPQHSDNTSSHDENGQKNDYYTRYLITYAGAWTGGNPVAGDLFYCTPSLACGIVMMHDTTNKLLVVNLFPRVVLTYSGAWAPGNPAVGATITVTASARRDAGVFTATAIVLAHDTGTKKITLGLTNGATFIGGDTLSDGTNSYTINTNALSIAGSNVFSVAALKYHRASGSFITDGFIPGLKLTVTGYVNGANNFPTPPTYAIVTAVAAADLTVSNVLVNEGLVATAVTFDAATDTIGAIFHGFPGQLVICSVEETGTWLPGDRVTGTDITGKVVAGTLAEFIDANNWFNIVPDDNQVFAAAMNLANLTSGGACTTGGGAVSSATFDTITVGAKSISVAGATFRELTQGSIHMWTDNTRPTMVPAELGQFWPFMSPGAIQQDRRKFDLSWSVVETGAWNIGDSVTGTDVNGSFTGTILAVDTGGNTMTVVPLTGSTGFDGTPRNGMSIVNNTTGGTISAVTNASALPYGYWPACRRQTDNFEPLASFTDRGTGVNEWRRWMPIRRGMLGRRGGALRIRAIFQIKSTVPASETNILELIFVHDWRYLKGEQGGLRTIPSDRRLGWQIAIPATVAQGGLCVIDIIGTGIHNLTQLWEGYINMSSTINTGDVGFATAPLIEKSLPTIYKSFIGTSPNFRPELDNYNLAMIYRCDGTSGAGVFAPLPFATVGASNILQDGSRLSAICYFAECWYEPGY